MRKLKNLCEYFLAFFLLFSFSEGKKGRCAPPPPLDLPLLVIIFDISVKLMFMNYVCQSFLTLLLLLIVLLFI